VPFQPGVRLRLRTRIIAATIGQTQDAVDIPAGAEILLRESVEVDPLPVTKQVEIEWLGKHFQVFAIDVRNRGEKIDPILREQNGTT
jgi:hypothetical protein